MNKTVYMIVGAPGSGKSWVCSQLGEKYHLIHHDGFVYLKAPEGTYVRQILKEAPTASRPVLIEAPFSISKTKEPLEAAGYKVIPIFIIEDAAVHTQRYLDREKTAGRWSEDKRKHLAGHLTRTQTYLQRARDGKYFHGTSEQVFRHLEALKH